MPRTDSYLFLLSTPLPQYNVGMYAFFAKSRSIWLTVLLGLVACAIAGPLEAAVIVFSNKTPHAVTFVIGEKAEDTASQKAYQIATSDVLSVPVLKQKIVWFDAKQQNAKTDIKAAETSADRPAKVIKSMEVKSNSIYAFEGGDPLVLKHVFSAAAPAESSKYREEDIGKVLEVPIKILVDDDEPRRREIWERDLRERVKEASDIFEKTCRIRFHIVKVDTWKTSDGETEFEVTFNEFQKQVKPERGIALAIGFTSQYEVQSTKRFHVGGTRGPFYPYILIREWSQHVGKPERLELLVHELGHVFGASHTRDQSSVMRPVVGDKQSNARSFRTKFDPLNTLAVYLFCEPIRLEKVRSMRQFSPESRTKLLSVYRELERQFPEDRSVTVYQRRLKWSNSTRFRRVKIPEARREKSLLKEYQ